MALSFNLWSHTQLALLLFIQSPSYLHIFAHTAFSCNTFSTSVSLIILIFSLSFRELLQLHTENNNHGQKLYNHRKDCCTRTLSSECSWLLPPRQQPLTVQWRALIHLQLPHPGTLQYITHARSVTQSVPAMPQARAHRTSWPHALLSTVSEAHARLRWCSQHRGNGQTHAKVLHFSHPTSFLFTVIIIRH